MKTKIFTIVVTLCLLCCTIYGTMATAYAYEEYTATFSEVKKDSFENLNDFPADSSKVVQYLWDTSALLWVEGPVVSVETANALNGSKSLRYAPHGDNDGWTLPTSKLGVSANKTAGTAGGYLLKLEFLVRFTHIQRLALKAYTSKDVQYQAVLITGDYQQEDNGILDDDPETKLEITKYGSGANEYAKVSFTIRSNVQYVTYYEFGVQIDPAYDGEANMIMDDLTFYKENDPVIEYKQYKAGPINEQFEGEFQDSVFYVGESNTNASKNANVDTEKTAIVDKVDENKALKDSKSLVVYGTTASQAIKLNSATVKLQANSYKLYFLSKLYRCKKFGINVRNAVTDEVIYNFVINPSSSERVDSVVNPLFDSSFFDINSSSVYTAYGEFELTDETDVYLEIELALSHKSGYAIFDDVNILESYEKPAPSTTYPTSTAQRLNATLNATYENISGNASASFNLTMADVSMIGCGSAFCVLSIGTAVSKKKKRWIAVALAMLILCSLVFASCDTEEKTIPTGYQVVHPERIEGKLDNPGIGWVILEEPTYGGHIDIGSSGDLPEASLASLSTTWAHIETSEGYYDWTLCDQAVNYWNETGRRVLLRISTDSCVWPYTYKATPDYLFDKYNVSYKMVDYTDPGPVSTAKVSDLANPIYLQRLDAFLDALYEHYKDNDMVDTVEIRGFGMWGEWHHGNSFVSYEDRVTTLSNIIDYYYNAFEDSGKTLILSASYDPDYISTRAYWAGDTTEAQAYQNFVSWSGFDKAWRSENTSFRRDGGANALRYDLDEKMLAEAFRSGKRVPILGEYANNYAAITQAGSIYTLETALDDILYKIRPNNTTALGWVAVEMANIVDMGEEEKAFIDRGNTMMGYRLAVDEARFPVAASAGSTFTVKTTWTNSAVGVYPYESPLEIKLLDSNNNVVYTCQDTTFDARTFVQGESTNVYSDITLPSNLANGMYTVAIDVPFNQASETEHDKIALAMGGEIGDSRVYKLGTIEIKSKTSIKSDNVVRTTWDKIDSVKLDKNSVYQITFHYMPHMDMKNFFFGNNDCYHFFLQSGNKTAGDYRWQDISGEDGTKTVTVATGDVSDYKIKLESINFDNIGVDEVWIEKVNAVTEDFTDYDIEDASTLVYPVYYGGADAADGMDNGCFSISSLNSSKKYLIAKTDINNIELKKDSMYSVTFDFKADGDVGDGGYYFLAVGDADSNSRELTDDFEVIGEWYERDDTYVTKKTFNFLCKEDNQAIYFGLNTVGSYHIDNLVIANSQSSSIVEGTDVGFTHNVIPTYDNIGLGKVETFDKGTFQASGFNWGQYAWGRMTFNPDEIPAYDEETNTSALLGRVEAAAYDPKIDNVWFEFVRSKEEYYPFEANKLYCVEFDYKVLKSFGSDNVFCFFRDDTLADRFAQAVNYPIDLSAYQSGSVSYVPSAADLTAGKSTGTTYHYKQYWLLGNHNHYQFMICMHGLWEVAVDNIYIYEVNAQGEKI